MEQLSLSLTPEEREKANALRFYRLSPEEKFNALVNLIELSFAIQNARKEKLKIQQNERRDS